MTQRHNGATAQRHNDATRVIGEAGATILAMNTSTEETLNTAHRPPAASLVAKSDHGEALSAPDELVEAHALSALGGDGGAAEEASAAAPARTLGGGGGGMRVASDYLLNTEQLRVLFVMCAYTHPTRAVFAIDEVR